MINVFSLARYCEEPCIYLTELVQGRDISKPVYFLERKKK